MDSGENNKRRIRHGTDALTVVVDLLLKILITVALLESPEV